MARPGPVCPAKNVAPQFRWKPPRAGEDLQHRPRVTTEREKVSRMNPLAIDFVPRGLEAAWPLRRWAEPLYGRMAGPPRGLRLGHASSDAMVLTCTFPRDRF